MPTKKKKDSKDSSKTKSSKKERPAKSIGSSRIEQHYSKIVVGFVVLTVALVLLIVYFTLSKTSIEVTSRPVDQQISVTTSLQELGGVFVLTDVEGSKLYADLDSTSEVPGRASGTVTLVNNYSQDQPLVETTRLLSDEGVLFRTQETVTVPAGGSVDVPVAADEEGAQGNIGPSRFEVVALWEGLKEDIYGTSAESMTGGTVNRAVVTAENIEQAKAELQTELIAQAVTIFQEEMDGYEGLPEQPLLLDDASAISVVLQDEVDVNEGDEVSEFTVTQRVTVAAPVINRQQLTDFIESAVAAQVPDGSTVTSNIALDDLQISVDTITDDFTDAGLTITLTVQVQTTDLSVLIDIGQLTNRTAAEVEAYLNTFEQIDSVHVQFSPFWVTRTPAIADNITFKVNTQ